VAALVTGSKILSERLNAILKACVNCEGDGDDCFDPKRNPALKREVKAARKARVPDNYIRRVIQFARQGYTAIEFPIYDTDWDSEAYRTVSGQNSNNSVRVTDEFLRAVEAEWRLEPYLPQEWRGRQDGESAGAVGSGRPRRLGRAPIPASSSIPPINDWHTCPAAGSDQGIEPLLRVHVPGRHACNLASLNLDGLPQGGRQLRYRGL
jgi:ribonucleoside-diphosphate reductase alpha chain